RLWEFLREASGRRAPSEMRTSSVPRQMRIPDQPLHRRFAPGVVRAGPGRPWFLDQRGWGCAPTVPEIRAANYGRPPRGKIRRRNGRSFLAAFAEPDGRTQERIEHGL